MKPDAPLVLIIVDGWGLAPPGPGNAVSLAKTPHLNDWRRTYPYTELAASGSAVGLSPNQEGNSEAGHMNIGAGRRVIQDAVQISSTISDGTFFRNPALQYACRHARHHQSTLHLMGMLGSNQSAHSDPDHLLALLMMVQNQKIDRVRLHLFTDGRDSPRFYAREVIEKFIPHLGDAQIATVMGRYYAMDRNKNWDRTERAYRAIVEAQAEYRAPDARAAVTKAYNRGESDEFISPTVMESYHGMNDNDALIFFNLRSDRARQLAKTFVQENFEDKNQATRPFIRQRWPKIKFVAMTDFGPDLDDILTAFPARQLPSTLPIVLKDYRQLYIAESEKYAHVTYFFNGGYADPVGGEDRRMISSDTQMHFDQTPAMKTEEITTAIIDDLENKRHDLIVANFANTDMVAHTGNLSASVAAMEVVDRCLVRIKDALEPLHGVLCLTADHGNIEEVVNQRTKEIDTEHSTNPVPFYLISERHRRVKLRPNGILGDIAPTILTLFGRAVPAAMTGRSLIIT